jgi:quercetin dioxygenase-like cupin family protein
MMENILQQLRDKTEIVPPFNPWFMGADRVMNLVVETGKARTEWVYEDMNISIAKTTCDAGTIFDRHYHPELETILVLEGALSITMFIGKDVVCRIIKPHTTIEFMPMLHHAASCLEKTIFIACTMPYSPNFPHPDAGEPV